MKRFISILLAVITVFMACIMPVQAERFHGGGGRGSGGHFHGDGWIWGPALGLGLGLGLGRLAYPYYGYPYYPYYDQAPVVVQPPTEMYVQPVPQQSVEPNYWYYCQDPKGYYPYVQQCPNGWMKVVPSPPPPQRKE
jgi:hypothetical protein